MRLILLALLAASTLGAYLWFTLQDVDQVLLPDPKPRLDHAREAAKRIEAESLQRVQDVTEATDR